MHSARAREVIAAGAVIPAEASLAPSVARSASWALPVFGIAARPRFVFDASNKITTRVSAILRRKNGKKCHKSRPARFRTRGSSKSSEINTGVCENKHSSGEKYMWED